MSETNSTKKRNLFKITVIAIVAVILIAGLAIIYFFHFKPQNEYTAAISLLNSGEYNEAIEAFESLNEYKDSKDQIEIAHKSIRYQEAVSLMDNGEFEEAIPLWEELGTFLDSKEQLSITNDNITYKKALEYEGNGSIEEAIELLSTIPNFKDANAKLTRLESQLEDKYLEYLEHLDLFYELSKKLVERKQSDFRLIELVFELFPDMKQVNSKLNENEVINAIWDGTYFVGSYPYNLSAAGIEAFSTYYESINEAVKNINTDKESLSIMNEFLSSSLPPKKYTELHIAATELYDSVVDVIAEASKKPASMSKYSAVDLSAVNEAIEKFATIRSNIE